MKKSYLITLLLFALSTISFAQDYEVRSVEHLPLDMTAKINNLTEKPNGGEYCAVLRIATQNILAQDRKAFQFTPDMGSHIRERRTEGGEILLWVSPGINYLTIKHKDLGNTRIYIPELLHGQVESLNTYSILIVGTKELPKESKGVGSCNIVFRPSPNDAVIFLNGDSIGSGYRTVPNIIAGTYHWSMEHPLYHSESGTIELAKGKTDTVDIALSPAYGYMRITNDYDLSDSVKVYLNGEEKGMMPFESDKLPSGIYRVAFEKGDTLLATGQIEVKDNHFSINSVNGIFSLYQYKRNLDPYQDTIADSLSCIVHTQFRPITGKITINSIPESTVIIDGTTYGRTPITIDTIAVGMHDLQLTSSGCTPLNQRVSVKESEETTYNLKLPRACLLTITSDEAGDIVHIDGEYVGRTPVTKELPFGPHTFALIRVGKFQTEKTINLRPEDPELTIPFSFGQHVTIEADRDRNRVYVDGEYMGKTPIELYLTYGKHTLNAERGWKSGSKRVKIEENQPISSISIDTRYEKPKAFLSNGAFFMTGNVAMYKFDAKQAVYGFNIGDIGNSGTAGWYISLTSNRTFIDQIIDGDYSLFDAQITADENGNVNQYGNNQPQYTDTATMRASALFGVALRLAGPVYLRVGAGAGIRHHGWKTSETNEWAVIAPYSWKNVEGSLGLQCCIYNFVLNADVLIPIDVLTEKKNAYEFRAGIGFCLRHKNSKR